MSISYKDTIENIDFKELSAFLNKFVVQNRAVDEQHTKTVFNNSQYFVFVYEDEKLVGAVRAISDGEWAVIYNFGIDNRYEGTKVEKELLQRLVDQLKGQHIFTNAKPESIGFYEANGFRRTKTAFTYVGFEGKEEKYTNGYFLPLGYKFENEFYKTDIPFPSHRVVKNKKAVNLTYTNSRDGIDYERVNEIIAAAFGGSHGKESKTINERTPKIKKLFDISEYVSFAYDGKYLVGVARAITDGAEEAYIQNVAVDPAYQGYGIGWKIVVNLGEEIQKNGLNPFLHTHPGAVGFYSRKGFLRNKTAVDYVDNASGLPPMPPEVERGFYLPVGYRFADEL